MLILTFGFSSVSIFLGISFYRKYSDRLKPDSHAARYARIADYSGRPIHLHFDYRPDESEAYNSVETEVDEIFHYGSDYFLSGSIGTGKHRIIYKQSRISNLRIDAEGQELHSLMTMLGPSIRAGGRVAQA